MINNSAINLLLNYVDSNKANIQIIDTIDGIDIRYFNRTSEEFEYKTIILNKDDKMNFYYDLEEIRNFFSGITLANC